MGTGEAGSGRPNIGVSFTVICAVDKVDGADRLLVLFPTAPCCPGNTAISGYSSPVSRTGRMALPLKARV